MKLQLKNPGKKLIVVTSVIVLGVIGGVSTEMTNKPKAGADTSPLVTEVDHQNDKLNNHEARITNLEGDTKNLQNKTNTPASTNQISVPTVRDVTAPASTSSTAPAAIQSNPVTVIGYREIVIDPDTSDCEYTYSDGTTSVFHWKVTNPQGAWIADSFGNNGHWEKTTQKNGSCDNKALGQPKS